MLSKKHLFTVTILAVSTSLFLAALLVQADQVTIGPFSEIRVFEPVNPQIPPISANISYVFTAEGSISALNPITVTVTISNANNSDFSQYYQAVGFYGTIFNSNAPTNSTLNSSVLQMPGFVKISEQPDGTFNGTDNLIWRTDSEVQTFLIPQPWYTWQLKAGPQNGEKPITHISGVAETLSWKNNEQTTRLIMISGGFVVLLAQPIIEFVRSRLLKKTQVNQF